MSYRVAIIGIRGITGEEILRILENHPQAELVAVYSREVGRSLGDLYSQFHRFSKLMMTEFSVKHLKENKVQLVFVCLPHGESMQVIPEILNAKVKVVDLSADFRLSNREVYEHWYIPHVAWEIQKKAVYGMPEFNAARIQKSKLVANPGCYVTAATFALKPLLQNKLIHKKNIVIDAKSGVSGGGRKLVADLSAWQNNFKAYKTTGHRHLPEVEQNLKTQVVFVPHLLPLYRGIIATNYVEIKKGKTLHDLQSCLEQFSKDHFFVEMVDAPPQIKNVIGTNKVQIYCCEDANHQKAVVISAIDNLVKGASGQAVQNMNLMFGLPEELGLSNLLPLHDNSVPIKESES